MAFISVRISRCSLLIVCCQLLAFPICAQVYFVPSPQRYISVTSYLGKETVDNFCDFRLQVEGSSRHYADWSLSVRLAAPIVAVAGGPNRTGRPFPADKIAFRWMVNDGRTGQRTVFLQEADEVLLVDRASVPIAPHEQAYADIRPFGSLKIAPGAYLDDYLSTDPHIPIQYNLPLVFTLYDGQMRAIGSYQTSYELVLQPDLTDAFRAGVEPDYALTVEPAAQNTSLIFHTAQDYAEGMSLTVKNAVKINAKTDFEVSVRALDGALDGGSGGSLPLSVLAVRLVRRASASFAAECPKTTLSTAEQTVMRGTSSDKRTAQYFHIRYDAKFARDQLASIRPGTYTVSLLCQILPR